jgi:predicted cupin superfamily sugar epimerase
MDADDLIRRLGLRPHPEGGHFAETYRAASDDGGRGAVTLIYFLLRAGERSHWHRIDAVEIWHWYAGAALELSTSTDGGTTAHALLGTDFAAGQRPQAVVPPGEWHSARSLGDWTLAGCTVAPAFEFARFTLAPPGWAPGMALPG